MQLTGLISPLFCFRLVKGGLHLKKNMVWQKNPRFEDLKKKRFKIE